MTTTAEKVIDKRRALGRGLESLLPSGPRVVAGVGVAASVPTGSLAESPAETGRREDAILRLPLDQIEENPYQTRLQFDDQALSELAESIRANGIVQPIVVRPSTSGKFVLILGERRCRAAKLAGEATVPAIVRQVSNEQAAEMTIVENLQRQDLNCLEQAKAFARLSREFGLTQEQIGQKTGCSRESVANYLRLLKLPESIQQHLAEGQLGFSEARVLLQLSDPQLIAGVAKQAIETRMSVALLSDVVDRLNMPPEEKADAPDRVVDPNVRAAESELARLLGCKVRISDRKGKGKIVIEYSTLDDFDRVLEMLKRED
ncbi:MAG TPA: ParB/RepB/Spo0J family partition protein [Terriglobales bacterium]|nr:ParB/RepB/Spo0J family partition protein [Terriglobales bacterium]